MTEIYRAKFDTALKKPKPGAASARALSAELRAYKERERWRREAEMFRAARPPRKPRTELVRTLGDDEALPEPKRRELAEQHRREFLAAQYPWTELSDAWAQKREYRPEQFQPEGAKANEQLYLDVALECLSPAVHRKYPGGKK